jgi:hypothetical protein
MTKGFVGFTMVFLLPLTLIGQLKNPDCSNIKKGTFYFYPSNSQERFVIMRGDSIQEEIHMATTDTSFWKVSWQNDCMFNLKFIRKSHPISDEEKNFYNAHTTVVKVINVTKEYYAFKAGLDSISTSNPLTDTLWLKAR